MCTRNPKSAELGALVPHALRSYRTNKPREEIFKKSSNRNRRHDTDGFAWIPSIDHPFIGLGGKLALVTPYIRSLTAPMYSVTSVFKPGSSMLQRSSIMKCYLLAVDVEPCQVQSHPFPNLKLLCIVAAIVPTTPDLGRRSRHKCGASLVLCCSCAVLYLPRIEVRVSVYETYERS
jgi:hypothetical protein